MKKIILFTILLFVPVLVKGATWTVIQAGGGDYTSIQPALDGASNGDIVEIQDSATYSERIDFTQADTVPATITLRVAEGEAPTIGQANGFARFSQTGGADLAVTIMGASPDSKLIAIFQTGDAVVIDNIGSPNFNLYFQDVIFDGRELTNTNFIIDSETYPGDNIIFERCEFYMSTAGGNKDICNYQFFGSGLRTVVYNNCLLRARGLGTGDAMEYNDNAEVVSADITIINCTIDNSGQSSGIHLNNGTGFNGALTIINTLFTNNSDDIENFADTQFLDYNGYEEHTPAGNSFTVNSADEYVDDGVDYNLATDSASREAGTDAGQDIDIVGTSRPQETNHDVGAYEFISEEEEETETYTPTWTSTYTPTYTPTWTSTWTSTYTPTYTPTWTPTWTSTFTPTWTSTWTPTWTPTSTPTFTPTWTPAWTSTWTSTYTPTWTETWTATSTPTWTPTATPKINRILGGQIWRGRY